MAESVDGKRLTELRVIDLKTELERRGLDKTGNKASLLERLSKAIASEGFDPDEYLVQPSTGAKAMKKASVTDSVTNITEDSSEMSSKKDSVDESTQDSNSMPENDQNLEQNNVEMESESLQEDSNTNLNEQDEQLFQQDDEQQFQQEDEQQFQQDEEQQFQQDEEQFPQTNEQLELECVTEESNTEAVENYQDEELQENVEVEFQEDQIEEVQKKTRVAELISEDTSTNDSKAEHNGVDNEDSINLTIGEDEAILLAEEVDSNDKSKDAGEKKKEEDSSSSDNKKADSKGSSGRAESSSAVKKEDTSSSQGLTGTKDASTGHKSTTEHGGDGSKSGDQPTRTQKKEDKDKKSQSSTNASSRNLWVSGLSSTTRATDLKQIFSKYGKVIGAKVVTNARTPGARCYGYVTMFTSDDAARCIQHLHRTELHGRVISVEKAKGDSAQSSRKREITSKSDGKDDKKTSDSDEKSKDAKKDDKEKGDENSKDKDSEKSSTKADGKSRESSQEKKEGSLKDCDNRSTKSNSRKPDSKRDDKPNSKRSWDRAHPSSRSRSRERQRRENVLSFAKIKEERERNRAKERERMAREEKRRRQEEMQRTREIERRHREEAARLEREREKLRMEREKIEHEKAELLRLERERQKIEREKIERERMEIKRQQMRVEDTGRRAPPPPPSNLKRGADPRRDQRETYEPDRKRMASGPVRRHSTDTERRGAARIPDRAERYESRPQKDFSRGGGGGGRPADHYQDSRNQRNHNPAMHSSNPRGIKESRGFERPPPSYNREVPRGAPASKNPRDERYNTSKPIGGNRDTRYADNGRSTGWHSGPPQSKTYHSASTNRNEQSNWGRSDNNRWANSNNISGNNVRHPGPQSYHQTSQMQPVGISNTNTRSYNTYDPYKQMQNVRKY